MSVSKNGNSSSSPSDTDTKACLTGPVPGLVPTHLGQVVALYELIDSKLWSVNLCTCPHVIVIHRQNIRVGWVFFTNTSFPAKWIPLCETFLVQNYVYTMSETQQRFDFRWKGGGNTLTFESLFQIFCYNFHVYHPLVFCLSFINTVVTDVSS